jgi:hypothetical protein
MSSEWNDPGASWHQPNQPDWDEEYEGISSPPPSSDEDKDNRPPIANAHTQSSSQNDEDDFVEDENADEDDGNSFFAAANADEDDPFAPPHSRFAVFQQFGEHLLPIFLPLLFAGLTFLFVLPLALRNHYYIHADHLWPVGIVIIALAILQGTVLFYADTNDIFWSLAIGGGFCLFVLIGTFAILGPNVALILLLIFVVIGFVAMRLYMHRVQEGYVDIVYAFGKYTRTLYPGINFRMPWETINGSVQTREVVWICPEQRVPMSHDEDVHLKASVSYQLTPEDAHLVAQQLDMWEENLQNLVCNELQLIAGALSPDDFLIWPQGSHASQRGQDSDETLRWEHINHLLFEKLRDKVASWGVQINWVQIRDITLTPRAVYAASRDAMEHPETVPVGGAMQYPGGQYSQSARPQYSTFDLDNDATERIEKPPNSSQQTSAAFSQDNPAPMRPAKIPKEEVLIQAYRQVQTGKITSAAAIRSIAANFEAVAADPVLNQNVSFNAALAAQTLYERADMYERQAYRSAPEISENETISMSMPSDMGNSLPNDENLTSGG